MMLLESSVSNATSCGIIQTTEGVINNHILIYALRVFIYSEGNIHNDHHIFIVHSTGGSVDLRFDLKLLLTEKLHNC